MSSRRKNSPKGDGQVNKGLFYENATLYKISA